MKWCKANFQKVVNNYLLKKDFIYLLVEGGKERNINVRKKSVGCLSPAPYWGPGPQPRHVP